MTDKCKYCGSEEGDCRRLNQSGFLSRTQECMDRQISTLTTQLAQARQELAEVKEDHRKVYQQGYQEWLATQEELDDAKERLELWRKYKSKIFYLLYKDVPEWKDLQDKGEI